MCGEQQKNLRGLICGIGSPPRVRGTVRKIWRISHTRRITPACAGNSRLAGEEKWSLKDHPRVCGEQAITAG